MFLAGSAGVVSIDGTLWVELIAFLAMLAILARYVYPEIVRVAEARQTAIAEQLREAEKARADAETRLKEAEAKLVEARKTAQGVVEAAEKSSQQLRAEMREKAEEESRRIAETARKEIEAERDRALQSVRGEVADMVVTATEKVINETLDVNKHKQLIDKAIAQVASGDGSR